MSTVTFDLQADLEELQARVYLDTGKWFTKKEILELVFKIGTENYDRIVSEIQAGEVPLTDKTIQEVLSLAEDLGPSSENLSSRVDEIV
ncbi:MAG: hypothetical protein R6V83_00305 [Candidatus Thorarchaeota archaeon]